MCTVYTTPVRAQPTPRWKLFSNARLDAAVLGEIFICHEEHVTVRHEWDAYPLSRPRTADSSFVLHETPKGGLLLHPSAIEVATSAMEVVAVSARNAALLVAQKLDRKPEAPQEAGGEAPRAASQARDEL